MIRWYADNSELRGIWGAEIPDILLFGGIILDETATAEICAMMSDVKSGLHGNPTLPFKWNFRDLEKHYHELGFGSVFTTLLESSRTWRSEIFSRLSAIDFKIIVSMILSYGTKRETLIRTRDQVTRFVFLMALQRVGLCVSSQSASSAEIVLDWPAEGKRSLFDLEYRCAHQNGSSAEFEQGYTCGPLKNIGFGESALFTSTDECSVLQVCDLIVGATRELVEEALGRKENSLGVALLTQIRDKFEGAPDNVVGRGVAISPRQGGLYERVRKKIANLYGQNTD